MGLYSAIRERQRLVISMAVLLWPNRGPSDLSAILDVFHACQITKECIDMPWSLGALLVRGTLIDSGRELYFS